MCLYRHLSGRADGSRSDAEGKVGEESSQYSSRSSTAVTLRSASVIIQILVPLLGAQAESSRDPLPK